MIVVDASVIASVLVYSDDRGRKARAVLGRDPEWAAPEHWKVEVFSVMRGLALGGKITSEVAARAVDRISRLGVDTVPIDDLLTRMWQFKANISAYDAPYVALAERRSLTLVTADGKLARAASAYCRVELVA
ncbi:type II toxin-antitoxin system VapC family toxin [Solwaraspora sp. WMMD406]|uniref:type II toxin-antitoxin system VapC family toxin n=1 Tax=Solwaraspora sp. WMMD406 TaxID=3016095 RepID=UPI002416AB60|nr:type II toxin-antitoxin system VapC family toxin [Solwaraspora sp. WMMD406]MDG4762980.1 type II toxin-antitoxin system VapC family toxin [Solwaraspora sp. WMMD406]